MRVTEFIIMLVYLIIVMAIGLFYRKRATESVEDYWVAGRSVGAIVNGFAYEAANSSAAAMMGFVALGYVFGLPMALTIGLSANIGIFLAMVLVAAPLRRSEFFTLSEFLEARYQSKFLRIVSALITMVLFWFYMIPQLTGAGLVGEMVLGIPYITALVIAGVVVVAYSALGGMWAVTWTDLLQGILLVVTIFGLGWLGIFYMGGLGSTIQAVTAKMPELYLLSPEIPYSRYIGLFFAVALFQVASPHLMMRFFTTKTAEVARASMLTTLFVHPLTYIAGYVFLLSAGVLIAPALDNPDTLTLVIVDALLPPVIAGLVFGGILAAIMSSIDAMLLAIGAAISHDIYRYIKPTSSEDEKLLAGQIAIWASGLIAVVAAINPPPLIGVVVGLVLGAIASGFFWPLVLGIYWKRANAAGAIAGTLGGVVVFSIIHLSKIVPVFAEVLIAVPISALLVVFVSLATAEPPKESQELVIKMHTVI